LRAQQLATDLRIPAVECVQQLFAEPQLDAIIILQNHWYGSVPIELALIRQKSILCLSQISAELPIDKLKDWHERSSKLGLSIIFGFTRRYAPATIRLQELLASKLGRIRELELCIPMYRNTSHPSASHHSNLNISSPFLEGVDWCRHLFKRKMQLLTAQDVSTTFATPCMAEILVPAWDAVPEAHLKINQYIPLAGDENPSWKATVKCEHGQAELSGYRRISWQSGTESAREELLAERSALELLLDLFCRRMLSGLVPLPDLGDLIRARELFPNP
jgi:hypothetical protein